MIKVSSQTTEENMDYSIMMWGKPDNHLEKHKLLCFTHQFYTPYKRNKILIGQRYKCKNKIIEVL